MDMKDFERKLIEIMQADGAMASTEEELELDRRLEEAATAEDKAETIRNVFDQAGGISLDEVSMICEVADKSAKTALAEIVFIAESIGQDTVPVEVIKEMMKEPQSLLSKLLWSSLDAIGIEPKGSELFKAPDDISDLLG